MEESSSSFWEELSSKSEEKSDISGVKIQENIEISDKNSDKIPDIRVSKNTKYLGSSTLEIFIKSTRDFSAIFYFSGSC